MQTKGKLGLHYQYHNSRQIRWQIFYIAKGYTSQQRSDALIQIPLYRNIKDKLIKRRRKMNKHNSCVGWYSSLLLTNLVNQIQRYRGTVYKISKIYKYIMSFACPKQEITFQCSFPVLLEDLQWFVTYRLTKEKSHIPKIIY